MSLAAARKAKETPDEIALADERQAISWSELDGVLNRATNKLLEFGAWGTHRRIRP